MKLQQRADRGDILFRAGETHDRSMEFNLFVNELRKAFTLRGVAQFVEAIRNFDGILHNVYNVLTDDAITFVLQVIITDRLLFASCFLFWTNRDDEKKKTIPLPHRVRAGYYRRQVEFARITRPIFQWQDPFQRISRR